jgi:hypothetical protein
MGGAREENPKDGGHERTDEYHSYVIRVRSRPSGSGEMQDPALSIRVEYVNQRQAMHFNELSGAFDFVAASVRRNVLHADP